MTRNVYDIRNYLSKIISILSLLKHLKKTQDNKSKLTYNPSQ